MGPLKTPDYAGAIDEKSTTKGRTRGIPQNRASFTNSTNGTTRGIAEVRPMAARTQTRPFLGSNDLVLVESMDDVPWRFTWDKRDFDVKPGAPAIPVPFPAVVNALGDPRSVKGQEVTFRSEDGSHGVIEARYHTLMRLCARYQIENEDLHSLVDFCPKVRVTTMNGDPITFPGQNPEADAWPIPNVPEPGREAPISVTEAVAESRAEAAQLRDQVAQLQRLVDERLSATPGGALAAAAESSDDNLGGAVPDSGPRTGI